MDGLYPGGLNRGGALKWGFTVYNLARLPGSTRPNVDSQSIREQGRIQGGGGSIAWDTVRFSDGRNNYFVY